MNFSFDTMTERERRMVTFGGIAALLLLVLGVVLPLDRSVERTHQRIEKKHADLAWMRAVGPELSAAGPAVAPPVSQESLLVVVDRAARESGLGQSLTNSEPSGNGALRVRLEKAPFGLLVGWLARLSEQHGIRVESATMDSTGEPDTVNAGLVLRTR